MVIGRAEGEVREEREEDVREEGGGCACVKLEAECRTQRLQTGSPLCCRQQGPPAYDVTSKTRWVEGPPGVPEVHICRAARCACPLGF